MASLKVKMDCGHPTRMLEHGTANASSNLHGWECAACKYEARIANLEAENARLSIPEVQTDLRTVLAYDAAKRQFEERITSVERERDHAEERMRVLMAELDEWIDAYAKRDEEYVAKLRGIQAERDRLREALIEIRDLDDVDADNRSTIARDALNASEEKP